MDVYDEESPDSEICEVLDYYSEYSGGCCLRRRPNAHGGLHSRPNSTFQPVSSNMYQIFANRFRDTPLEEYEGMATAGMSNSVTTSIRNSVRDTAIGNTKTKDKRDRATVENAIDPMTRRIIGKMLNRGEFDYINGCFSTGKEANVYHATKVDGAELAIKVYKTSTLTVKNRDPYLQGDRRFTGRYPKHNQRKMVMAWAEKEERNLKRLRNEGIRCPAPMDLRSNVLAMQFLGKSGWPAPKLKDAALSLDKLREVYVELIIEMRKLYQRCKLVHADLSEYNILYFEGHLYIIDVSQAVERDHYKALDFLRRDCFNVSEFFKKNGVAVMTTKELFDFIVDPDINDDSIDSYLEEAQQKILARGVVISAGERIADSVFVQDFISKTLDHIVQAEEDVQCIINGKNMDDMYIQTITGLNKVLSVSTVKPVNEESNSGTLTDETLYDSEDDSSSSGYSSSCENEAVVPGDKKAARKENKRKVKEEKRESRKCKIPKAVKKKKRKMAKAKKCR